MEPFRVVRVISATSKDGELGRSVVTFLILFINTEHAEELWQCVYIHRQRKQRTKLHEFFLAFAFFFCPLESLVGGVDEDRQREMGSDNSGR